MTLGLAAAPGAAAFYFDLASPEAYLAAERVLATLGAPARWTPVHAEALGGAEPAFRCATEREVWRSEIERRARAQGVQPMVWPEPSDPTPALLAATYAASIGKGVAFALAAFRQAFAGGRRLDDTDTVLIAGAACEIHPRALERAVASESVARALRRATREAASAGVGEVPAVRLGDRVHAGPDAPERAAAELAG